MLVSLALGFWLAGLMVCFNALAAEHVVLISVDGLRADAITALGKEGAPNFYFLMQNGATTLNARTDADFAVTLPNHTCMLTGLGVNGENGHNYHFNGEEAGTLHEVKGRYVSSIFDVVHSHGLRTAFFATKAKFDLYLKSYGAKGRGPARGYVYNDQQLIDVYQIRVYDDVQIVQETIQELTTNSPKFIFLHITEPDYTGHKLGWDLAPDSQYLKAVQEDDRLIGRILEAIKQDEDLKGTTAIIVTADHGGHDKTHGDMKDSRDITIPFLVWGAGVAKGTDLYALNPEARKDPGTVQVPYSAEGQPIRNGDAGNLALSLLGLPAIEHSTINARQDLAVK